MHAQLLVETAHEADEVSLKSGQPVTEFDDVKSTLAALDFADQALSTSKPVGKVGLSEAAIFPKTSEHGQEDLVVTGVQNFGHSVLSPQP